MKWIAFIIINATANPTVLSWPQDGELQHPSIDVRVQDKQEQPDATIDLSMRGKPNYIHRMVGVQADTFVNVPVCTTIEFESEDLCRYAAATLREQSGVLSVSCLQIRGSSAVG